MEARLFAGESGYDVVSASSNFFSREIKAGVYEPLNKALLPNWKNLDPRVLAIQNKSDPVTATPCRIWQRSAGFLTTWT